MRWSLGLYGKGLFILREVLKEQGRAMGFWGAVIMGLSGTIFLVAAVVLQAGSHSPYVILPVLVIAAFLAYAFRIRRGLSAVHMPSERADKVIQWASIGEGIGIVLAINIVKNLGHPDWVLPAIAFVVGLHFLPMAFAIPFKPFYVLGICLIAAAVAGTMMSQPMGSVFAACAAGLGLWTAAALALRREMRGAVMSAVRS
jgi:hypothetical protein